MMELRETKIMNRILMSITMQSPTLKKELEGNEVKFSHIAILAIPNKEIFFVILIILINKFL